MKAVNYIDFIEILKELQDCCCKTQTKNKTWCKTCPFFVNFEDDSTMCAMKAVEKVCKDAQWLNPLAPKDFFNEYNII